MNGALALALALSLQTPGEPPPASPSQTPVVRFLKAIGDDVKELPSKETALIGLAGTIGALVSHPGDDNLSEWAEDLDDSGYAKLGGVLGDGWIQGSAALGTYIVGSIRGHERARVVGADLARAQILNAIATRMLKFAVSRERPNGGRHAFPSGHASATFVSAAVIDEHFGWRAGVPAYAIASFVGWSRVREDEHWLSDVVAGATLGTIIGRAVSARTAERWTLVPAASSKSVGVMVVFNPR